MRLKLKKDFGGKSKGEFVHIEGKKIKIISCKMIGHKPYSHLEAGTIHTIVLAPARGRRNGQGGVWVMGRGKLVFVFRSEYTLLS